MQYQATGLPVGLSMVRVNAKELRLFILIVLPVAVAALIMLWSTSRILNGISASVDRQEATRTWQAIESAFATAEERLAGTVIDNAHWDDAAKQAYGAIDMDWMSGTWGYPTTDINYDTMYILDSTGTDLVSFHQGVQAKISAREYFGEALKQTLEELPMDGVTFDAVSTLVNTPDGLTLMAAAPILPTTAAFEVPITQPHVLIFARSITEDMLAKMGKQYIVDKLGVKPIAVRADAAHTLHDRWKKPVAVAVWQERHPGDLARKSYSFSALATILALIGVMFPIAVVHSRAIRKLDDNEKRARLAARMDSLSGLPNRAFLLEELTQRLLVVKPNELALVFIDLDGFKAVNDAYDHETGDKLIRAVAAGLSSLLPDQGIVARLGGDEFAVLLSGPDVLPKADAFAKQVLSFVKQPFDIDGRIANIGASIGIAELGNELVDPSELMRRADIAMFDAKDGGRNRCRHFNETLDAKRDEDASIANELRAFILHGIFDVAYQPMVDARDHQIVGVEALARWPSSSNRTLAPERFIPIAEEHGLIDGLGALVFRIACRDIAQRQDLRLAVNVSPHQINNPNLVSDIRRIAGEYCMPMSRLEIEFTETVLIRNPKRARQVIGELQDLGVTVALDDFGTGYASVGYLRDYAFDKIKLDRSLTQAISRDPATQQVVQGTILIAKGLSADIIAEGIETEVEAQLMRLAGCQQLQGYYFGMPQGATAVEAMLTQETNPASFRFA